jgi:hypothetical protein
MTRVTAIASAAICIIAGIYLLQTQAAGDEGNWLETIAHGMGIYFIGKGLFVGASLWAQGDAIRLLQPPPLPPREPAWAPPRD